MNQDDSRLSELVKAAFGGRVPDFQPLAYYDAKLDRITVLSHDCSVTEISTAGPLILLERNYPGPDDEVYVGFAIEPTLGVVRQTTWPGNKDEGLIEVLLRTILADFPSLAPEIAVARQILKRLPSTEIRH